MKIQTNEQLLALHIEQLHQMERILTKAIPKLIKEAESDDVKDLLDSHLLETREQVKRLEEMGQVLDIKLESDGDDPVEAIIDRAERMLKIVTDPIIREMMLIDESGKLEHYEMGCYEAAILVAGKAGMDSSTLRESLDEEVLMMKNLKMINSSIAEII